MNCSRKNFRKLLFGIIFMLMVSLISTAYAVDAEEGGTHTHDYSVAVGNPTHEKHDGSFTHKQIYKCRTCTSTKAVWGVKCTTSYAHEGNTTNCRRNYYCKTCRKNARYDTLAVTPTYQYSSANDREHNIYFNCSYCKNNITVGTGNHTAKAATYTNNNDGSTHTVTEECSVCYYKHTYSESHSYGNNYTYVSTSDSTHNKNRACNKNCGYVQTTQENHDFTIVGDNLDDTFHEIVKTCKICGKKVTQTDKHEFDTKKDYKVTIDGSKHTVTERCKYCPFSKSYNSNHNFSKDVEYEEIDGNVNNHYKKMKCLDNCGYNGKVEEKHDLLIEEESIDKNRHTIITSCQLCSFRVEVTEAHKKAEKTEEKSGKKYKVVYCSVCDEEISREEISEEKEPVGEKEEPIVEEKEPVVEEKEPVVQPHVHDFSGPVTYKYTSTGHIRIAKCTGCMVQKTLSDKEEKHSFGLPYYDLDYDEENLNYSTHQTKHYIHEACVCKYVKRTLEDHKFGEPVTRAATEKRSGSKTWTCPCKFEKREIIPKLGSKENLRLAVGASFMPEAEGYTGVTWNISNSKLAHKLSDGRIICDAVGSFTVTGVKSNNTVATYNIEVYQPEKSTHKEATVTILTEDKKASEDLPLVVYFGGAGQNTSLDGALEGISREGIYDGMELDLLVPTYNGNDNKAVTQNIAEAMAIINEYLNNPDLKGRPLYIDGHSNGGHGAILLAELATENGIEVKELVLADANWTKGEYKSAGERLAKLAESNPNMQIYNYACPHDVGEVLPNETTSHITYRAATTQGLNNLHNGVLTGENSGHPSALAKTIEKMHLNETRTGANAKVPSDNYLKIYSSISDKKASKVTVSGVEMNKIYSDTTSKGNEGNNSKHEIIYSLDKDKVTTVIFGGTGTNPESTMGYQEQSDRGYKANGESVMYIQSFGSSDSHKNEHNKEVAREAVKQLVDNGVKNVNAVGLSQGGYYVLAFYEACVEAGITVNGAVFADAVPEDLIVDGQRVNPVDALIDTGLQIAIITTSDKERDISQTTRETADKYAGEKNIDVITASGGHSTAQYELSNALSSIENANKSSAYVATTDVNVLEGNPSLKEERVCVEASHKSKWEITYSNIKEKTHTEEYYCKACNLRWTLENKSHENKDECKCGYLKKDETTVKAERLVFRVNGVTINEGESKDLKGYLEVSPSNADISQVQYRVTYVPEGLSVTVSNKGVITYSKGSGTAIIQAYDVKSKSETDIAVIVKSNSKNAANKTSIEDFKDVVPEDWYYEQVKRALQESIIKGTSDTTFNPNGKLTLGDSVTLLGRLDSLVTANEKEGYQNLSEDVSNDMYYAPMMAWANTQGLIERDQNGNYNPQEVASREWQANVIYNYFKTFYPSAVESLKLDDLSYSDKDNISPEYTEAVKAMQKLNIMIGDDKNNFNPKQTLTRAQMATMIGRIEEIVTMTLDGSLDTSETDTTTTTTTGSKSGGGGGGGGGSAGHTPSYEDTSWEDYYEELPPLPMQSGDLYYKESMFFGRAVLRPGAGNPSISNAEWANYERILAQRVKIAGWGTRAGVVEAALFLTSLPYAVPYRGTPMNAAQGQGAYYHIGLNNTWGRRVPLKVTVTTSRRTYKAGGYYLNGLDCGGFVNWAMINGGARPESFRGMQSTSAYGRSNRDLINLPEFRNQVRPGDLAFVKTGNQTSHIGLVVGVSQKYVYIAESSGCVQTQRYGKSDSSWWILPMSYNSDGRLSVVDWS